MDSILILGSKIQIIFVERSRVELGREIFAKGRLQNPIVIMALCTTAQCDGKEKVQKLKNILEFVIFEDH